MKWILLILLTGNLFTKTEAQQCPFHKGVNLAGWLTVDSAPQINLRKFNKQEFTKIKSLGVDVFRLPIDLPSSTNKPDFTIDPILFVILDSVVQWSTDTKIHLVLTLGRLLQPLNRQVELENIWGQISKHFAKSSEYVHYEILNEPSDMSAKEWGAIQYNVIKRIRQADTLHYIVVGGSTWDAYDKLDSLPQYDDKKLIYTFHYYNPVLFTHQQVIASFSALGCMPFPYDTLKMPILNAEYKNTSIENSYKRYSYEATAATIKKQIDSVVKFRNKRGVPVYCSEFGASMTQCASHDRYLWIKTTREILDNNQIAWTTWNYNGNLFGLYKQDMPTFFDNYLNDSVVKSLSFAMPVQKKFSIEPDTNSIVIYDDFLGEKINPNYQAIKTSFYSSNQQQNGNYCIQWSNAEQMQRIGFDFYPDRDLSILKAKNYVLSLRIRSNTQVPVKLIFSDTKESNIDCAWRVSTTLTTENYVADLAWHKVTIPLADFIEDGCWDSIWGKPQGIFDWAQIDKFEIASENAAFNGKIWFDEIKITEQTEPQLPKCAINPKPTQLYYKRNQNNLVFQNKVNGIILGDTISLGVQSTHKITSKWSYQLGATPNAKTLTLNKITKNQLGRYIISSIIDSSCIIRDTFFLSPRATIQYIILEKGLNLVSVFVYTDKNNIDNIFKNSDVQSIKTFSLFWKKNQLSIFNTLSTLDGGETYMIISNSNSTFSISGLAVRTSISKSKTWQLIGTNYPSLITFGQIFSITNCSAIKNVNQIWYPTSGNLNQTVNYGSAYFIK